MEDGDFYTRWRLCSKKLVVTQHCIVIPIGSLTMGLCRHRAILFKVRHFASCTIFVPITLSFFLLYVHPAS